jgi:hypothetical protein
MAQKSFVYIFLTLLCFSFLWERKLRVKWCDEMKEVNHRTMTMDRFLKKTSLLFTKDTIMLSHVNFHGGGCYLHKEIRLSNDSIGIEYGFDSETKMIESIIFGKQFQGAIFDDVKIGVTTRKEIKVKYEDWFSGRMLNDIKKNWRIRFYFSNETKKLRALKVVR